MVDGTRPRRRRNAHQAPGSGREAERQEGPAGGAQQADDRPPAEEHAPGAREAGCEGPSARRRGRARARGPESRAAVRDRKEAGHSRSLEVGEVGSDRRDPQIALTRTYDGRPMRAVALDDDGLPELVELPEPAGPGLLVRVLGCGLCGSDVEKIGRWPAGSVLGHEVAGVLEN